MAIKRGLNAVVELTGEEKYKQAISDITNVQKTLNSELSLCEAEFETNAGSMEHLTKKGEILAKQVEQQEKKVEQLKNALEDAEAAGDKGRATAEKYRRELNYNEAQLHKLNHKLEENEKALADVAEEAEKGTSKLSLFSSESQGLGDVLNSLSEKLGIQLPEGLNSTLNGMLKVNPVIAVGASGFVALSAGIKKAYDKLKEWTILSANRADDIETMAIQTGLSTDALQEWTYAAEFMDVSVDTVTDNMTAMVQAMKDARDGSGGAKEAFEELKIQVTNSDGSLRNANEVFLDTIDALGEIENVTERDATAMEIFGESARNLNPLINTGIEEFEKYAQAAHETGYVLDNEALGALVAVDDAQQRLLKSQEAVTDQISTQFAPYMEDSLTKTADFIEDLGTAFIDSGVVDSFGKLLSDVTGLIDPIDNFIEKIPTLKSELEPLSNTLATISSFLHPLRSLSQRVFNNISANRALSRGETWEGNAYNYETGLWEGNFIAEQSKAYSGYHASGTDNFPGGWTWVGEAGPERVYLPQGSQIQSAQESRSSGVNVNFITIDAKNVQEFNDIVRIVENMRRNQRMGG